MGLCKGDMGLGFPKIRDITTNNGESHGKENGK